MRNAGVGFGVAFRLDQLGDVFLGEANGHGAVASGDGALFVVGR